MGNIPRHISPSETPSEAFEDNRSKLEALEERERQGPRLPEPLTHWHERKCEVFTAEQRSHTTILFGGVTTMHDKLVEGALVSLGYRAQALDCPDTKSLQIGKEFGNRGQCNPTYFTVGNLIKYLSHLRDEVGLPTEMIIERYVFVTASACGPCRFGMYATEYRKALSDAGFDGFRVLLLANSPNVSRGSIEGGLALTPKFFVTILKAFIAGDVLNALGYRIRPYEVVAGSTDTALLECQNIVFDALRQDSSVLSALLRCRRTLRGIEVNRLQPKPKVSVIGEFWAMTTEGEGNYRLQRFLESEGAECEVQMITSWLLYSIWQIQHDTRIRMNLRRGKPANPFKTLALARAGRIVLEKAFKTFAWAAGLKNYPLASMDDLARLSREYYFTELRGGEGHMEVGKVIHTVKHNKAHLVLSVKPFGCMPSSGVSDGVQSLVTARNPDANFLPIETTGDGAVSTYSRVQMALFKARQKAEAEFEAALESVGMDGETAAVRIAANQKLRSAIHHPQHSTATTAANALLELI